MKIFLVIALGICALGWIFTFVGVISLELYMIDKNYELPTEEELEKYTNKAWKVFFNHRRG